jgi:hypothetical protein
MTLSNIPDPNLPTPNAVVAVVTPKKWSRSWIIVICVLAAVSAGLDAVIGSPVLNSKTADIFIIINNFLIGVRRFFTSQPIG